MEDFIYNPTQYFIWKLLNKIKDINSINSINSLNTLLTPNKNNIFNTMEECIEKLNGLFYNSLNKKGLPIYFSGNDTISIVFNTLVSRKHSLGSMFELEYKMKDFIEMLKENKLFKDFEDNMTLKYIVHLNEIMDKLNNSNNFNTTKAIQTYIETLKWKITLATIGSGEEFRFEREYILLTNRIVNSPEFLKIFEENIKSFFQKIFQNKKLIDKMNIKVYKFVEYGLSDSINTYIDIPIFSNFSDSELGCFLETILSTFLYGYSDIINVLYDKADNYLQELIQNTFLILYQVSYFEYMEKYEANNSFLELCNLKSEYLKKMYNLKDINNAMEVL